MDKIRKPLFYLGVVILVVIEILDLAGVLDMSDHKIDIVLGILLIAAGFLVDLYEKIAGLGTRLTGLEDSKHMNLPKRAPKEMSMIIGSHLNDVSDNLRSMLEIGQYRIDDMRRFSTYYEQMLRAFPKSDFYATSDLHGSKFWDEDTARSVDRFTSGGGSMERIFFLRDKCEKIEGHDQQIVEQQLQAGVEVYGICSNELPDYQNFLVEGKEVVAWHVQKAPDGTLKSAELNVRNNKTRFLLDNYNSLKNHPGIRKYDSSTGQFIPK